MRTIELTQPAQFRDVDTTQHFAGGGLGGGSLEVHLGLHKCLLIVIKWIQGMKFFNFLRTKSSTQEESSSGGLGLSPTRSPMKVSLVLSRGHCVVESH
jgi:hypothetical protein